MVNSLTHSLLLSALCNKLNTKLWCHGMTVKGMPDILNVSKRTKNFEHDLKLHAHIRVCTHTCTHTHAMKYFSVL